MDMISAALSAAAKAKTLVVKSPGDTPTVKQTESVLVTPIIPPKQANAIRVADLSSKLYLETESEVDDYLSKLKTELLAVIAAGQRAYSINLQDVGY